MNNSPLFNKKIITIFGVLCLSFMILCTFTFAEPTTSSTTSTTQSSFRFHLTGEDCETMIQQLFLSSPNNNNEYGIITPYNTYFEQPMSQLQWINFTDVTIKDWNIDSCVIDYNHDQHYYTVVAQGVDAVVEGRFAYSWEPFLPVIDDNGKYQQEINNATIITRLQAIPIPPTTSTTATTTEESSIETTEDSHVWRSFITTYIPHIEWDITETDYAEWYEKQLDEHDNEIRFITSLISNSQLSTWLNHYCDENGCDPEQFYDKLCIVENENDQENENEKEEEEYYDNDHNNTSSTTTEEPNNTTTTEMTTFEDDDNMNEFDDDGYNNDNNNTTILINDDENDENNKFEHNKEEEESSSSCSCDDNEEESSSSSSSCSCDDDDEEEESNHVDTNNNTNNENDSNENDNEEEESSSESSSCSCDDNDNENEATNEHENQDDEEESSSSCSCDDDNNDDNNNDNNNNEEVEAESN